MGFTICPAAVVAAPVESVWELLSEPTLYDVWWDACTERIVPEVALTEQADARVRAELAQAIAELNAAVRHHNLVVTAASLHLPIASLDDLVVIARSGRV